MNPIALGSKFPMSSGGRGAQGPAAAGLRAPRLAAARASCCAVHTAPAVKRCAFPAEPCALYVAPRGALSLPGVTPDPLLSRHLKVRHEPCLSRSRAGLFGGSLGTQYATKVTTEGNTARTKTRKNREHLGGNQRRIGWQPKPARVATCVGIPVKPQSRRMLSGANRFRK